MTISQEFQRVLDESNLTRYGAAQIIGAETDKEIKAIHRRISRRLDSPSIQIQSLDEDAAALGYEWKLVKKDGRK